MQELAYLNNQKELRGATHIGMLLSTSRMHSAWSKKRRGQSTKPKHKCQENRFEGTYNVIGLIIRFIR